jgi:hypothetical protein
MLWWILFIDGVEEQAAIQWEKSMWLRKRGDEKFSFRKAW